MLLSELMNVHTHRETQRSQTKMLLAENRRERHLQPMLSTVPDKETQGS